MKLKADDTAVCLLANEYGLVLEGFEPHGKSNGRDTPTWKWMRLYPSPHVNVNGMSYQKNGNNMMSSMDMACRFRSYRLHPDSRAAFDAIPAEHKAALDALGILAQIGEGTSKKEAA